MNHEEYNNMNSMFESCTPSECITKMFELTGEDGRLCIPEWPHDTDFTDIDRYYAIQMNWTREDAEKLMDEHARIVKSLSEMALLWKNEELGFTEEENRGILTEEQFKIWNTYIRSIHPEDMDYMHFYDVCEKMEVFAASKEEAEYYYAYTDRMREEAEHRLGGRIAQTDQIIRAQRLLKLMAQDAPQILIDNESRLLAQAMVVGRFATKMKVKRVD